MNRATLSEKSPVHSLPQYGTSVWWYRIVVSRWVEKNGIVQLRITSLISTYMRRESFLGWRLGLGQSRTQKGLQETIR